MNQNHMKINIFSIQIDDAHTRMALSYAKLHPVLNGSSGPGCHGVSSSLGSGRGGGAGSRWDAKNPATTAKTLGKDGKRCTNCEDGEMGRLFFGCEFRKTPISQVIF